MQTKEYTVTKLAGPKVAGRVAKAGATLELTEAEASAELLAGAIVPKGKEADPFKASTKLAGIRARARGEDAVEPEDPAEGAAVDGDPPPPPPPVDETGGEAAGAKGKPKGAKVA